MSYKHVEETMHLNLARKWRSRNFDEIVGQDIAVRMLKNSLYIGQLFPVYLFSGQRGCGKTSTARVFAAAINCEQLSLFKQDPKQVSIPCLTCTSCKAMAVGKHPDCIEIDAASHTGVDHVRQIIDAASLLPLLGNKKIYLIDEAHMLSKAAFNAFLKILEEPPASVVFILATTDPEKIVDTVKSRCFQLLFKPIASQTLVSHLEVICNAENISYDKGALTIIAQESEGAARDALNLVEQVRFAHTTITKEAVYDVLGYIDDERLLLLFDALLNKTCAEFAVVYSTVITHSVSPTFLWQLCIELLRASLSCTYNIPFERFGHLQDRLRAIIQPHSADVFIALMQLFYEHELLFLKTATPHAFLQMLLFQISKYMTDGFPKKELITKMPPQEPRTEQAPLKKNIQRPGGAVETKKVESVLLNEQTVRAEQPHVTSWGKFIQKIDILDDPLVASVFKQGRVVQFNKESGELKIIFPCDFAMFEEMILKAKKEWQPLFDEAFNVPISLVIVYHEKAEVQPVQKAAQEVKKIEVQNVQRVQPVAAKEAYKAVQKKTFEQKKSVHSLKIVDVSQREMWKKTHMVLDVFPGTVTEFQGD